MSVWPCVFSIVSQTQADKNKSAAPGVKNSISFPLFVELHCLSLGLKESLSPGFKLQPEAFFHIQACQLDPTTCRRKASAPFIALQKKLL